MSPVQPSDPSEPFDDDLPDDSDRGWYTKNGWIITPLVVFLIVGLICIALHTFRVRRLRRRVQLAREEAGQSGGRIGAIYGMERPAGPFAGRSRAMLYIYGRPGDGTTTTNNSASLNSPMPAHAAAARTWGERWQWRGTTNRQDDGLDEFGEAPPPYEQKKESRPGTVNENADAGAGAGAHARRPDGVELAQMEPRGGDPPAYGGVVGASPEHGSSLPERPEPTQGR